jgi:hypothetical protein
VKSFSLELLRRGMNASDQRTSGVDQLFAGFDKRKASRVADAVRRDQHRRCIGQSLAIMFVSLSEATRVELMQNDVVVNQLAMNRRFVRPLDLGCAKQSVAHSEAHSQGLGQDYLHVTPGPFSFAMQSIET